MVSSFSETASILSVLSTLRICFILKEEVNIRMKIDVYATKAIVIGSSDKFRSVDKPNPVSESSTDYSSTLLFI